MFKFEISIKANGIPFLVSESIIFTLFASANKEAVKIRMNKIFLTVLIFANSFNSFKKSKTLYNYHKSKLRCKSINNLLNATVLRYFLFIFACIPFELK